MIVQGIDSFSQVKKKSRILGLLGTLERVSILAIQEILEETLVDTLSKEIQETLPRVLETHSFKETRLSNDIII